MTRRKKEKIAEFKQLPNSLENPEGIKGKWNEYLQNDNPLVLELGCGKGEYTLALARKFPEKNFIGVDVKGARLWKGAGIAEEENLKNAKFLRILIETIPDYFSPGEVSELWITFPDPYPKKSKAKKRLISPRFLSFYQEILRSEGIINFKTDNSELYEYGLEVIKEEECKVLEATKDLYNSEFLSELTSIKTYYEGKFLDEGKSIKYIKFRLPAEKLSFNRHYASGIKK